MSKLSEFFTPAPKPSPEVAPEDGAQYIIELREFNDNAVESHRVPDVPTLMQFVEQFVHTDIEGHYIRIQLAN